MIEAEVSSELRAKRELVGRVVSSDLICKSARLREVFVYLCRRRVLDESADHINELELGHQVYTAEEFRGLVSTNLEAFIFITQVAVKQMLSQGTGGSVTTINASLAD